MAKPNLYYGSGAPKRIRCYMFKGEPRPADYITVVYTYANHAGYPVGTVLYRAMNANPYHPACGISLWGEGHQHSFSPGGSVVEFSELPNDCKEIVLRDYRELWESE